MYQLENYSDGMALVVGAGDVPALSAHYRAATINEAVGIVLDLNRTVLSDRLAMHRYNRETSGLEVGDLRVLTDTTSQSKLTSAFVTLNAGLVPDLDWKAASGWQRVTLETIKPVATAVAAHSRACFRGERVVQEAIAALSTLEAVEAFDLYQAFDTTYRETYAEVMGEAAA